MLGLLPQIESKDRKASPYRGSRRAFSQHLTQREPALKQADPRFDATPKPLQISESAAALMSFLGSTQPADFRNADSTDSQPTKLFHIIGTVIATIRSQFSGRLLENLFGLVGQRNKLRLVTGIATMHFIVNDHSRVVLDQL
jgi:hypothetical protein